jgi:DNA polymerase-3 subunit alpha
VGFHLSAHPLDTYAAVLKRLGVVPSAEIASRARAGGARLKLAGTVVASKERNTRTGSRMAWVTLSDSAGTYEVTLFSEVLSRARPLLDEGTAVLVTAEARLENEALRLTANDIESLERAAQDVGQGIRLWLESTAAVEPIRTLLAREGRGKGRVVMVARTGQGQEVEMALPGSFAVSPKLMQAMKVVPGVADVEAV